MRTRLVLLVASLVLAAVAADAGVRIYAENRFAVQLQRALGLEAKPDLDLGGFPFILAMTRGRLPSASVRAEGAMNRGLRVQQSEIHLRTVRFAASEVFSGRGAIRAAAGDGSATVTDEDLTAFISMQGYHGRVTFVPGVAVVDSASFGVEVRVRGPVSIRDGMLVFTARELEVGPSGFPVGAVSFAFDLPRPFEGLRYAAVRVEEGRAVFDVRIEDAVIPVQPASGS